VGGRRRARRARRWLAAVLLVLGATAGALAVGSARADRTASATDGAVAASRVVRPRGVTGPLPASPVDGLASRVVRPTPLPVLAEGVAASRVVLRPGAGPIRVDTAITDTGFSPSSQEVAVGTTVVWTNQGLSEHTVTADDGSFDSGRLVPGKSFAYTFSRPGTFAYHCALHPNERGTVSVTAAGVGSSSSTTTSTEAGGATPTTTGTPAALGYTGAATGGLAIVAIALVASGLLLLRLSPADPRLRRPLPALPAGGSTGDDLLPARVPGTAPWSPPRRERRER